MRLCDQSFKRVWVEDGLVLDLGCGTGKLTRLLAGEGYDMISVDLSEEMLEVALEHEWKIEADPLFTAGHARI